MNLSFIGILEALFSLIVVGLFMFFIWAKIKKKPPLELYNDTVDSLMGIETPELNLKNPLSGLKRLNVNKTIR